MMNVLKLYLTNHCRLCLIFTLWLISGKAINAQVQVTDFTNSQFELSNGKVICLEGFYREIDCLDKNNEQCLVENFQVVLLPERRTLLSFFEEHRPLVVLKTDSSISFKSHTSFYQPDSESFSALQPFKTYHVYISNQGNILTDILYEYHGPQMSIEQSDALCAELEDLLSVDEELIFNSMSYDFIYNLFYGAMNENEKCIYFHNNLLNIIDERNLAHNTGGDALNMHVELLELYNGLRGVPGPMIIMDMEYFDQIKPNSSCR